MVDKEAIKWFRVNEHPFSAEPWTEWEDWDKLIEIFDKFLVQEIDTVWLATDYCVADTVKDLAKTWKYQVNVILDWCAWVASETTEEAIEKMREAWAIIK